MPSLPTKPAGASTTSHVTEEESKKHLDHEIRNMIAALTNRLTKLHSVAKLSGGPPGHGKYDDTPTDDAARGGLGVVTLAGTNQGATMRSGLDEIDPASSEGGQDMVGAYVNSNFQAVNNSILLGGSYNAEDPGVHMVIEDYREKKEEKKKKKDVVASKDHNKELHKRSEAEE